MELMKEIQQKMDQLRQLDRGLVQDLSDGYHSFKDLYEHRLALTAALFNTLAKEHNVQVHKARYHHDGGGFPGYFIVVAELPTGTISYHYENKDWDKFHILAYESSPVPFDGHTADDTIKRLLAFNRPPVVLASCVGFMSGQDAPDEDSYGFILIYKEDGKALAKASISYRKMFTIHVDIHAEHNHLVIWDENHDLDVDQLKAVVKAQELYDSGQTVFYSMKSRHMVNFSALKGSKKLNVVDHNAYLTPGNVSFKESMSAGNNRILKYSDSILCDHAQSVLSNLYMEISLSNQYNADLTTMIKKNKNIDNGIIRICE